MNVILLTSIIFALAVPSMALPSEPCAASSTMQKHEEFIKKHILPSGFDTNSKDAWKNSSKSAAETQDAKKVNFATISLHRHLKDQGLCGRAPVQSFIEKTNEENVLKICGSAGRRLSGAKNNLCISQSPMKVFDIKSTEDCKIQDPTHSAHRVVVACDKVENKCRPVHYEIYKNQSPGNIACS